MKEELFIDESEILDVLKILKLCDNSSFARYISDEGSNLCEEAVLRNAFFNYSISVYGKRVDGEISTIVIVSMPAPTSKAQSGYLMACYLKDVNNSSQFTKKAFTRIVAQNELTKIKIKVKSDIPWRTSFEKVAKEMNIIQEATIPFAYGERTDLIIYSFMGEYDQ